VPQAQTIGVFVLVKAAPVMTSDLDETVCVAGVRTDGGRHEWVRLHPVPFQDLADESKFAKYQTVSVSVIRHDTDRRPETWSPLHGSIVPGESVGPQRQRVVVQDPMRPVPRALECSNQILGVS
jgi:hypothetical protein